MAESETTDVDFERAYQFASEHAVLGDPYELFTLDADHNLAVSKHLWEKVEGLLPPLAWATFDYMITAGESKVMWQLVEFSREPIDRSQPLHALPDSVLKTLSELDPLVPTEFFFTLRRLHLDNMEQRQSAWAARCLGPARRRVEELSQAIQAEYGTFSDAPDAAEGEAEHTEETTD